MGKSLPFLSPQESGMDASQLRTIEQQVGEALDEKKLAGAVTMVITMGVLSTSRLTDGKTSRIVSMQTAIFRSTP